MPAAIPYSHPLSKNARTEIHTLTNIPAVLHGYEKKKCLGVTDGIGRRVAFVRTDASKEIIASIINVKRISKPGTILALTSN
jgi:hypothetical protein